MKKLMLALLTVAMLLTAAMAEEVVFPSRVDGLASFAGVLSAAPYSFDVEQTVAQYGWVDFIKGISFPCRVGVSQNGRQLQATLDRDFAFRQPSLSVRAENLCECEFSYSAKAGCYVTSDVKLDVDTQGLTPFEFVCAHWNEATFEYSAQSGKDDIHICTIMGSPESGEVTFLQIEEQKKNGSGYLFSWEAVSEDRDASFSFGLSAPVTIDSSKYTATITASYGDDGALLERDGSVFAASFRTKAARIQVNLDAQGQPVYTVSTASGALYNTDGALSLLARWDDAGKAWKMSGTPTKNSLPSMDDAIAALSIRIE